MVFGEIIKVTKLIERNKKEINNNFEL